MHRLQSIEELPSAIRSSLRTEVHASDVDKFLNLLEESTKVVGVDYLVMGRIDKRAANITRKLAELEQS